MVDSCASCFFGQRFQWVSGQYTRVCCFNAPYAVAFPAGPALTGGHTQHLWPPVLDDDWCGDGIDVGFGTPFTPTLSTWPWNKILFYGAGLLTSNELTSPGGEISVASFAGGGTLAVDCFTIPVYVEAEFDGEGPVQADTILWGVIEGKLDSGGAMQADIYAVGFIYAAMRGSGSI